MIDTQLKNINASQIGQKHGLKDVRHPVQADLKKFKSFYKKALRTDVFILDHIVKYLLRQKGKQLRPTLVFMSARLFGEPNESTHIAATMIELLHTATLTHDDVVDEANVRRGFLSINKLWKNKGGVLLGDFLLSKGMLIALENDEFELLKVLSNAVKQMSEGELRQLKAAHLFNMTEEYYFKVISEKTASLIASCCQCGAISTASQPKYHKLMYEVGLNIGMAFQIKDDLLDYSQDDVGKPRRNDIRERKVTLPFIKALQRAKLTEKTRFKYLMWKRKKSRSDIEAIVNFVKNKGGLYYAQNIMKQYMATACKKLESLPPSSTRSNLAHLIEYIVNRKK
jgi:octaprenyl-diphosphate synthase